MKRKNLLFLPASALLTLAGCATYERPPVAVSQSNYTQLEEEEKQLFPKEITTLTLEEAQRIAIANNPGFRSILFAINSAKARYYQSFSSYAPTLNAGMSVRQSFTRMYSASGTDRYNTQQENYTPALYGQWLIFDGLSREMNLLAARSELRETEALRDDAGRLLLRAVAYAYNDILLADARRKIAAADMEYSGLLLRDAENKFNAGTAPYTDLLNFRIRYRSASRDLIEAEYSLKAGKYVLAAYFGLTDGTLPDRVAFQPAEMPSAETVLPEDAYLDMALADRPDLKAFRAQYEKLKYAWWSSLGAFAPTVTFNYELGLNQQRTVFSRGRSGTEKSGEWGFGYGVEAGWNLFSGGADFFRAREARARLAEADWQLAEVWVGIVSEVRTAYENYLTGVKQAKLSEEILLLSRENRDKVEQEYRIGTAEVTRMNEAQRDLIDAENTLALSIIQVRNGKAQLLAAVNAVSSAVSGGDDDSSNSNSSSINQRNSAK